MSETDDLRQFMRELLARFDRSMGVIDRRLDAQAAEMREQASQLREQTGQLREQTAALRDMRAEIQANTRGLLHVLDELRGSA